MTDITKIKRELIQFAYDRSEHEHNELSETWKLLDTKAQATAGIAGVFVAAAFAFVRNTYLQVNFTEKFLLSLALVLLTVSIFSAVLGMVIRPVSMPLSGADTAKSVDDIFHQPEAEWATRQINLIADTVNQWDQVNDEIRKILETKGNRIKLSQAALVAASIVITAMTLYAIYCAR